MSKMIEVVVVVFIITEVIHGLYSHFALLPSLL